MRSPRWGQIVVHNAGSAGLARGTAPLPTWPEGLRLELLPAREVTVLSGAVLFRLVHEGPVTSRGHDVADPLGKWIEEALRMFAVVEA